mgnify:CR=1 FL=1
MPAASASRATASSLRNSKRSGSATSPPATATFWCGFWLAKQVHRTKSTVTALVEKLERNGYVLRIPDPEDSRGVLVRLTDKGRALEPAFEAISNGLQRLITDRLSEEEAALLDRLLDKCVNG